MKPQWKTLAPKSVASAGTAEPLSADAHQAFSILITANNSNTGYVYIGDNTVSSSRGDFLAPGESLPVDAPEGRSGHTTLSLAEIYIDADTSGNSVRVQYLAEG